MNLTTKLKTFLFVLVASCTFSGCDGTSSKDEGNDTPVANPELTAAPLLSTSSINQGSALTITLPINSAVGGVTVYAHESTNATAYNYPINADQGNLVNDVTGGAQDLVFNIVAPLKPDNWQIDIYLTANNGSKPNFYRYTSNGAYEIAAGCLPLSGIDDENRSSSCNFSSTTISQPTELLVNELTYTSNVPGATVSGPYAHNDTNAIAEITTHAPTVDFLSGSTINPGEVLKISVPVDVETTKGYFSITSPYADTTVISGFDLPYAVSTGVLTQYLKVPLDVKQGEYEVAINLETASETSGSVAISSDYALVYMKDVVRSPVYETSTLTSTGAAVTTINIDSTGYTAPVCDVSISTSTTLDGTGADALNGDTFGTAELTAIPVGATVSNTVNCLAVTIPVDQETEFVSAELRGISNGTTVFDIPYSSANSGYRARGAASSVSVFIPINGLTAGEYYLKYSLIGGDNADGVAPSVRGENIYAPSSPNTSANIIKTIHNDGTTSIDTTLLLPIITVTN